VAACCSHGVSQIQVSTRANRTTGDATAKRLSVFTFGHVVNGPIALVLGLFGMMAHFDISYAQIRQRSVFAGGGLQKNFANATINAYDGSTACGVFTTGVATHPSYFIGYESPREFGAIGIRISGGLDDLSTSFTTRPDLNRNTPLAFRLSDHSYVPIERERAYDPSLQLAALHFLCYYDVVENADINLGFYAGAIVGHSFTETERILSPSDAVYDENRLTHRTIGAGSLTVNTIQAGAEAGLQYSFHFQNDLWLVPRLEYRFALTSISPVSSSTWRTTPLAGTLAIAYRLPETTIEPPFTVHTWDSILERIPKPPMSTAVKQAPMLAASIAVLDTNGNPILDPKLEIERTHVLEVFPMLHYVFFEDGSAQIPPRYDFGGEFSSESDLAGLDALGIHHRILDIVGKRLAQNPRATITIAGTRSERSKQDSLTGSQVATARAQAVATYFTSRWKIEPSRIKVITHSLPDAASDDRNPNGQAENRRVELISNDPEITRPIVTERIERTATPPSFNFEPHILAGAGVKSATITVRQGPKTLMTADALTGAVTDQYVWTLDERSMPDSRDSLVFELTVIDSTGQTAVATGSIYLAKSERDKIVHRSDTSLSRDIHRYSLILFDYSSSQLDKRKADALMSEMARSVSDSSRIRLTGHTDRTGDEEFNDALARQRVERAAQILAKRLAEHGQAGHAIEIESRGSRDQLFDNSLPEGRLLSRTVRAYIEEELK
jgi:outer membrane protein OmpA-like peptidoglycan-associated protein